MSRCNGRSGVMTCVHVLFVAAAYANAFQDLWYKPDED